MHGGSIRAEPHGCKEMICSPCFRQADQDQLPNCWRGLRLVPHALHACLRLVWVGRKLRSKGEGSSFIVTLPCLNEFGRMPTSVEAASRQLQASGPGKELPGSSAASFMSENHRT